MPASTRLPSARVRPRLARSVRSPGLAIRRTSVLCSSPSAPRLTSLTIQATSPLPQREEPAREYRLPLSHPQSRDSPPADQEPGTGERIVVTVCAPLEEDTPQPA